MIMHLIQNIINWSSMLSILRAIKEKSSHLGGGWAKCILMEVEEKKYNKMISAFEACWKNEIKKLIFAAA